MEGRGTQGWKISKPCTFRTKKETEIEAAKVEERKYYGQTINDRNMRFDEAVKDWLEHKKANVKESTFIQLGVLEKNAADKLKVPVQDAVAIKKEKVKYFQSSGI